MKRLVLMIIPALICEMVFTLTGCSKEKDEHDKYVTKKVTVSLMDFDGSPTFDRTVILVKKKFEVL